MKTVKSFALLLWLFLPTIVLLSSCMTEYQVTKTELADHSNYALVKVKLKSGTEYECDTNIAPVVKENKIEGKLLNGKKKEFDLDEVETLLIEETNILGTLGLVAIGGVLLFAIVFVASGGIMGGGSFNFGGKK